MIIVGDSIAHFVGDLILRSLLGMLFFAPVFFVLVVCCSETKDDDADK